ncbi:unnamed protein product [Rotaria sp. Silwood1]|nr:unnamed protein product [Rotaria sp. Silwood1]CAF3577032.1 unnamed protein product [Rotaria sp. Silwood1]CAF4559043.1 unnamed protein product [Rotaria sp. Silwood1]CAF4892911.1 unnamed protein product [Rotaria sp. Silwood1]CAF5065415.1 unnamed protein product [Rotaria sp. Silwood1]
MRQTCPLFYAILFLLIVLVKANFAESDPSVNHNNRLSVSEESLAVGNDIQQASQAAQDSSGSVSVNEVPTQPSQAAPTPTNEVLTQSSQAAPSPVNEVPVQPSEVTTTSANEALIEHVEAVLTANSNFESDASSSQNDSVTEATANKTEELVDIEDEKLEDTEDVHEEVSHQKYESYRSEDL